MKRTKTNLPAKQEQPVIDTEEVFMTLETMEQTIIKSTDLVQKINARLVPLRDELNKLNVRDVESLVTLFSINRLKAIDKLIHPNK